MAKARIVPHPDKMEATLKPLAYRPKEAATVLGVSRATIYNMMSDGRIAAYKLGGTTLIRHSDLERILDEAPLSSHTKFAQASMR